MTNGRQRVLVTGANGFVGRSVCRRLAESGYVPRAGLRDASQWPDFQASHSGQSECAILGDISTCSDLRSALSGVSDVVHLAARVHILRDGALDPLSEYRRTNFDGTRMVALAAAEQGVRRMIFVSSVKVHGEFTSATKFCEADEPDPQDPYALSKWETEKQLQSIAAQTGLEVVIVRPPMVYGPQVRANFLALMKVALRGFPLPLPETNNLRSMIGVENLAHFLVTCVGHASSANQTFLVSDGEDISTRELVRRLAAAGGRPSRFLPVPASLVSGAGRVLGKSAVVQRLLGSLQINSDKATRLLGWRPPLTLNEGLGATVRWYLDF